MLGMLREQSANGLEPLPSLARVDDLAAAVRAAGVPVEVRVCRSWRAGVLSCPARARRRAPETCRETAPCPAAARTPTRLRSPRRLATPVEVVKEEEPLQLRPRRSAYETAIRRLSPAARLGDHDRDREP